MPTPNRSVHIDPDEVDPIVESPPSNPAADPTGREIHEDVHHDLNLSQYVGVISLRLDLSPEVYQLIQDLARDTGGTISDVLAKGVALFQRSLNAHDEGKAVGIALSRDVLDTEFVGFRASEQ